MYRLHRGSLSFWTLSVTSFTEYLILTALYWFIRLDVALSIASKKRWTIAATICTVVLVVALGYLILGHQIPQWRDWLKLVSQRDLSRERSAD